jgi:hypothetical protein
MEGSTIQCKGKLRYQKKAWAVDAAKEDATGIMIGGLGEWQQGKLFSFPTCAFRAYLGQEGRRLQSWGLGRLGGGLV